MPKLYYTPTSCGAGSFIAATIAGVKLDAETVDLQTHKTASGADFYAANPKGNVPTIVLDDGTVINENTATLMWVADQKPGSVAPAPGTSEYYAHLAALAYVASEVHPAVGVFFGKPAGDVLAFFQDRYNKKLDFIEKKLLAGDKKYLVGNKLHVADIYLYIVLSWIKYLGGAVTLDAYPKVKAFFDNVDSLDVIKAAHARMATKPATTI